MRVAQIGTSLGGFILDVLIDNQRGEFEKNAPKRADQLRRKLTELCLLYTSPSPRDA